MNGVLARRGLSSGHSEAFLRALVGGHGLARATRAAQGGKRRAKGLWTRKARARGAKQTELQLVGGGVCCARWPLARAVALSSLVSAADSVPSTWRRQCEVLLRLSRHCEYQGSP